MVSAGCALWPRAASLPLTSHRDDTYKAIDRTFRDQVVEPG